MLLQAKMMLRIDRKLVKPGESFEAPKSQAALMIVNGFAIEIKSEKKTEKKEETGKPKGKPGK